MATKQIKERLMQTITARKAHISHALHGRRVPYRCFSSPLVNMKQDRHFS